MMIIMSLVFSYFSKVLFSGFLQFKGNFGDGQNISKYHDIAPRKNSLWTTAYLPTPRVQKSGDV